MIRSGIAGLLLLGLLFATGSSADDDVHWTYAGEHGPDHWASLSPEFAACGIGVNQSPIDLVDAIDADLPPLQLDYRVRTTRLINNGHTLQADVEPGSGLVVGGQRFELLQLHLHSPSEHRIDGEIFPLEAHLVHRNAAGELAVVGALFREGSENPILGAFGEVAPPAGQQVPLDFALEEIQLRPEEPDYFRYNGSLTTPPCSEGVRWFVLARIGDVSKQQVEGFLELIGEDARGPQPLNARLLLR